MKLGVAIYSFPLFISDKIQPIVILTYDNRFFMSIGSENLNVLLSSEMSVFNNISMQTEIDNGIGFKGRINIYFTEGGENLYEVSYDLTFEELTVASSVSIYFNEVYV